MTLDAGTDLDVVARFPPVIESIATMRHLLRRTYTPEFSNDEYSLFLIAFTEIAANAVKAHRRAGIDEPIELRVRLSAPASVTVIDRGHGFAPTQVQPADEDSIGLGLVIACGVRPNLTIVSGPAGTAVTLPYAVA